MTLIKKGCPGLHPQEGVLGQLHAEIYEKYRPTVAVAAVAGWRELLLVQPSKHSEADDHPCWIIPQGGVERHQSPVQALGTELGEELGLEYSLPRLRQMLAQEELVQLGYYVNEPRRDEKPKLIIVFAMVLTCPNRIRLNEENSRRAFAKDFYMLQSFLGHTRPVKTSAIMETVSLAYEAGLLGWSAELSVAA